MFEALLDQIRRRRIDAASDDAAGYFRILRDVASGEHVDAEAIAIMLQESGRTEEQFRQDAETMRQRMAWAADVAKAEDARRDRDASAAEIARLEREIEEATRAIMPKLVAARARVMAADAAIGRAQTAADRLTRCELLDPAIVADELRARERLSELARDLKQLDAQLRSEKGTTAYSLASVGQALAKTTDRHERRRLAEIQTAVEGDMASIHRRRAAIKAEQAEAERELIGINARKLVP